MAGTCLFSTRVTGSVVEPPGKGAAARFSRAAPSFSWRIPVKSGAVFATAEGRSALAEAPSCIFVGPVETASQEVLEALYRQARDSYYSGKPLIVDDMFDKVELKLRYYGSKSVIKYPRCSLRRLATYADAEEDPSQAFALAGIWVFFLAFGILAVFLPAVYFTGVAHHNPVGLRLSLGGAGAALDFLTSLNRILLLGFGFLTGYPIALASVKALQRLSRQELVALKGSCPNCGEEVFAFVQAKQSYQSQHGAECHVCESSLVFRTKVEQSISQPSRRWVYGRIYLVTAAST